MALLLWVISLNDSEDIEGQNQKIHNQWNIYKENLTSLIPDNNNSSKKEKYFSLDHVKPFSRDIVNIIIWCHVITTLI
jgi:hypothetical protein